MVLLYFLYKCTFSFELYQEAGASFGQVCNTQRKSQLPSNFPGPQSSA